MITIKMRNESWRVQINSEEWEVGTRKELDEVLKELLNKKEKYGKIK